MKHRILTQQAKSTPVDSNIKFSDIESIQKGIKFEDKDVIFWDLEMKKGNRFMQRFFIILVISAVCIAGIIQVIAYAPEIDNGTKRGFEIIGFLFLVSCAVGYLRYRINKIRNR